MRNATVDDQLAELATIPSEDVLILMAGTSQQVEVEKSTPLMHIYDSPQWQALRAAGDDFVMSVVVLSAKHDWTSAFAHTLHYADRVSRQKIDAVIERGINVQKRNSKGYIWGMTPVQMTARGWGKTPWKAVVSCGPGEYARAFEAIVPELVEAGYIDRTAPHIVVEGTPAQQASQICRVLQALALVPSEETTPPAFA